MTRTIRATYRPAPRWSREITRHDGLRCIWRPAWVVKDGPHAGERAFIPVGQTNGPAWAPDTELVDRE